MSVTAEDAAPPVSAPASRAGTSAAPIDEVRSPWTNEHLALAVFVLCVLGGAAWVLFGLGDHRWFQADEWDFVAARQAGSLDDLFRPHSGHWVTAPVLIFRLLWNVFHFNYTGYLAVLVCFGAAFVVLLRIVMRRAGVGPWIATITPLGLLVFGGGEPDVVWAFQITFVGALVFGVAHLLLLDHDGPIDRHDWFGLLAGVFALTFSGVGVALAVAAGLAALIRRGWRAAVFHSLPLMVVYGVWWLAVRPEMSFVDPTDSVFERTRKAAEWVVVGFKGAFASYGYVAGVGVVLGLLAAVGLVLAWKPLTASALRVRAAVPVAMLPAAAAFLALTGLTRSVVGSELAESRRYVYVVIALALPAVAVAADTFVRRWRWTAIGIVPLLLVGIPGNVREFGTEFPWTEAYFTSEQQIVRCRAATSKAQQVPADVHPKPFWDAGLTIGWLRRELALGTVPEPGPYDEAALNKTRGAVGRLPVAR